MRRWLPPFALVLGIALYVVYVAPSSALPPVQEPTPTADIAYPLHEVRIPYKNLTAAPGFMATYLIHIRNLDVLPETYEVAIGSRSGPFGYTMQDFLGVPDRAYLSVDAGQEATIALRISAQLDAVPGAVGTARLFVNPRSRDDGASLTLTTYVGSPATATPTATPAGVPIFATNTPQAVNYLPQVTR